jgi:uncharacterized membrane protein YccC
MRNILKTCIIGLIIILLVKFILIPYLDKNMELSIMLIKKII